LHILFSAFSAYSPYGSESLVGHHYARVLGRHHQVSVVTCAPTDITCDMPGIRSVRTIDLGGRDFNEVSRASLLAFELRQWRPVSRLLREGIDLVHRVNPCSIDDPTLLAFRGVPLVIGPLLSSGHPPESFREIIWREIRHHKATVPLARRIRLGDRVGRLLFDPMRRRWSHLKRARRVLVGTAETMQEIPRELHSRCEPIVYGGVEHEIFTPPASGREMGKDPFRLLWVGRLKPHKGIELLLRACASIRESRDFTLTVIGGATSWYEGFLKELVRSAGLESRIRWIRSVSRLELVDIYREHQIFCFPSVSDTYGIALLEAMSSGMACVASDIAGPREILPDGTGIRIPVQSPEQYIAETASALSELMERPRRIEELGAAARARILERHDWGKIGERLEEIYRGLG
jgi:glycosyltransferase involved in cell wall biosynthesis